MIFTAQLVGAKVLKSQGCGRIELDMPETECMRDGMFGQLALQSLSQPVVRVSIEFVDKNEESMPKEETPLKSKKMTVYERLRWEVVKGFEREENKEHTWKSFKLKAAREKDMPVHEDSHISSKEIWTPAEAEAEVLKFQGLQ